MSSDEGREGFMRGYGKGCNGSNGMMVDEWMIR